jgi:ANTAR domain
VSTTPCRHEDVVVAVTAYAFRPTAPGGPGGPGSGGLPGILGRVLAEAVVRDRRHAAALATADQLDAALRSRPVVDQACGIVMHVVGVDAATAFDLLRRISQRSNRRLSDLAAEVVRTRSFKRDSRIAPPGPATRTTLSEVGKPQDGTADEPAAGPQPVGDGAQDGGRTAAAAGAGCGQADAGEETGEEVEDQQGRRTAR